jgi:DNA-binding transcriptional MerR regulator
MQAIYLNSILTLVIGMIIGLNATSLRVSLLKTISKLPQLSTSIQQPRIQPTVTIKKNNRYFDELEVRLLKAIIDPAENGIDIPNLNALLNLKKLSEENQRQRRHLFLKELNLKLFLLFGIREGITRVEFDSDKRMKRYILDEKFDITQLENLLTVE